MTAHRLTVYPVLALVLFVLVLAAAGCGRRGGDMGDFMGGRIAEHIRETSR